jgi:AcrR family transcriptional regulator
MGRVHTINSVVAEVSDQAGRRPARADDAVAQDAPQQNDTARRMLEVAERLFATHGIEQVPLRQIVVEAGQRNRSALHYHFGSREALVTQLLNYRLTHINDLRMAYLDGVAAAGKTKDVRAIVHASVSALADTIVGTPWGASYVQVLAQTMFSPSLLQAELLDRHALRGVIRSRQMLSAALPEVPRKVMEHRLMWFNQGTVFSLADWYQRTRGEHGAPPVDELADYMTAALSAPVTRTRATRQSAPAAQAAQANKA